MTDRVKKLLRSQYRAMWLDTLQDYVRTADDMRFAKHECAEDLEHWKLCYEMSVRELERRYRAE